MYKIPEIPVPPMIPLQSLKDDVWKVIELEGPHAGMSFACDRRLVIGRSSKECNIVFPSNAPGISKQHCEMIPSQEGVLLRDLNSSYGTFMADGSPVSADKSVLLKKGDIFFLADKGAVFQIK